MVRRSKSVKAVGRVPLNVEDPGIPFIPRKGRASPNSSSHLPTLSRTMRQTQSTILQSTKNKTFSDRGALRQLIIESTYPKYKAQKEERELLEMI